MTNPLKSQALQRVFLRGALVYQRPDLDFYEDLASGSFLQELHDELKSLGFKEHDLFGKPIEIPSYRRYEKEYIRCFVGLHQPSARPIESLYKVWTNDRSNQLGIGQQKGYLMGDSALHIQHLIEGLGLEIPEEYLQMPDHLSILFELFAAIIEIRHREEAEQFLEDHLDWLGDLKESLIEIHALPFFIRITGLFHDFLEFIPSLF